MVEAGELKKSFEIFRHGLEEKVFGTHEVNQLKNICDEIGIQGPRRTDSGQKNEQISRNNNTEMLIRLIDSLEKTSLDPNQKQIAEHLKSIAQTMQEDSKTIDENRELRNEKMILESQFGQDIINLKPVLEECMGQMELLEELIRCYHHNILEFIGSFKVYLGFEDFSELRVCCQKILPSVKMIRTTTLTDIVLQMDKTCKTNSDITYLKFLYDQFLMEYPKIEKLLYSELNELKNM